MGYQIELRHLHYFKTLAEELHFRKAAERLFIAQPGLSRQIKQLEVYYGTSLFFRNKRRVELTSAGQYLYREVKHVFEQLDRIEAKMEKMAAGKSITLKVGFIGSAIQAILPELLIDLNHLHPSIDLSLNELSTSVQLELLKQFEQDVGFVRMEDIPTGLDSIPILRETFSLVVPKNRYTNLSSDNIQLNDFRDTPFILFAKEYSSSYYDLVMSIFRDHAFKPIVA
ncbi:MAG: LysR family transcriptional regulator, partial [Sphingobacterium sp.]